MVNLEKSFTVKNGIRFEETDALMFADPSDPSAGLGQEAPIGSVWINTASGQIFVKRTAVDTDWTVAVDPAVTPGQLHASGTDTTPGSLTEKLSVTANLVKTLLNSGADEELQLDLSDTTVIPGTYTKTTFDAKGRATGGLTPSLIADLGITNVYTKTESDALIDYAQHFVVQKNPQPGQFSSVAAAITAANALVPSSANRVVIEVYPGEYTESPFTVPGFVYMIGLDAWGSAHLKTNDNNNHFITLAPNSGMFSFGVTGPTNVGFAAVDMQASGVAKAYWLNIRGGYYGIWAHAASGTARVHCIGVVSESITGCNALFRATGNSNIMMMQSGPMTATGLTYGAYADGATASITMDLCQFRNSGGTSCYADNGAAIRGISCSFAQGVTAIHHGPNGASITIHGSVVKTGGYTTDLIIAGNTGSVTYSGALTMSKISHTGSIVPVLAFADPTGTTPGQHIHGELYIGPTPSSITPLTSFIAATASSGVASGGQVTRLTGLDVQVAAGSAFFETGSGVPKISWATTPLTLPANTEELWLQVNSSGVVSFVTVEPNSVTVAVLGTASTDATGVVFLASHNVFLPQPAKRFHDIIEHGVGPVHVEGGVVTKNGSPSLLLDVTATKYFVAGVEKDAIAGTGITFVYWYRDGAGSWNTITSQTAIDAANYDDNTGTLAPIPAGRYKRDLLFVAVNDTGTEFHTIYGQETFASLTDAITNPEPPDFMLEYGCRLAGILVLSGAVDIATISDQRPKFGQFIPPETNTDRYNILAAGGVTAATSGTVNFGNANNVTFGMASNSNGATVTASASYSQSTAPGAIVGSNATYTSGSVVFTGSNAVTVRSTTGQQIVIDAPVQTIQTQNVVVPSAGTQTATSGTVAFANSNNVTFGMSGSSQITASIPAGATATGNLGSIVGSNATYTSGAVVFTGSNAVTVRSTTGQAIVIDVPTQTVQTQNVNVVAAGTQTATSGTVAFVNSNNVTFGMSGSSQITASIPAGATATGNLGSVVASNATYTSGAVIFTGSNAATVRSTTGQQVVIDVPTQTTQAQSFTLTGNTAGNSTVTGNVIFFEGGNNVTLSGNNNTIVVSAGNAAGGQFSAGVSNLGNTAGSTGITGTNVVFVGSNNITLSQSTGANGATISFIGGAGAAGNTGYISAGTTFASLGTVSLVDSNGISFGVNGQSITASYTVPTQTVQTQNVVVPSAGTQTATSGTVAFANSNNVTFGMSGSSQITASIPAGATATGNLGSIVASNATYTSGAVVFTGSNAATVRSTTGQQVVIDVPVQTVQTQGLIPAISGTNSTGGGSLIQNSTVHLMQANGFSFIVSNNSVSGSYTVPVQTVQTQNVVVPSAGTQTATSGTVAFANSNNVTFGMSGSSQITASIPAGATATGNVGAIVGSNATYTSGSIVFTGSNAVTVRSTTGQQIVIDAPVQTVQPGIQSISAGTNVITTGNVIFSNSNNVSFGADSANSRITASIPAGATATGNLGAIAAGTQTATSGTVIYSNSNNVSFGLNNQTLTASVPAGATATGNVGAIVASNATYTSGNITFTGSNIITIQSTTGQQVVVVGPIFSNSNNVSFGQNGSTITATATFAQSADTNKAGTGFTTAGNNIGISGTLNTNGLSFSATVAAQTVQTQGVVQALVMNTNSTGGGTATVNNSSLSLLNSNGITAFQTNGSQIALSVRTDYMSTAERNNYFFTSNNTFANSTHSHGNPTLALTNLSGTTASASNGLTLSLSAAAPSGIVVATNNTGGGTSTITGSVSFGAGNGLTFYQSNGSVVGSYTDAGAGGGISAVVISAGTTNTAVSNFSFANSNGISFGINGSTITANAGNTTLAGYVIPYIDREFIATQIGQNSVFFQPMNIREDFAHNEFLIPANYSAATNSSNSATLSILVGIYTRNGNSLSLASSTSSSFAVTNSGTVGSYSIRGGMRNYPVGWTNTVTAGNYWIGILSRTTTGGGAGMTWSNFVGSQISSVYSGRWNQPNNASNQLVLGMGMYSSTTTALPTGVPFASIQGSVATHNRPMIYQFASTTS